MQLDEPLFGMRILPLQLSQDERVPQRASLCSQHHWRGLFSCGHRSTLGPARSIWRAVFVRINSAIRDGTPFRACYERRSVRRFLGNIEPRYSVCGILSGQETWQLQYSAQRFTLDNRAMTRRLLAISVDTLIKPVRGECFPFAPSIHRATRGTGGTTSHSTRSPKDGNQVAGYQDEREMYRTIAGT
jgi:hypothetical protein